MIERLDAALLCQAIKDVSMISVGLDHAKWHDLDAYARVVHRLKVTNPEILTGTNLLMESSMFKDKGKTLFEIVQWCLDKAKVDRVFLL